ncbi:restriction endonuclease subunit S [Streptomyces sp. NBC_01257]|uniref:restriction endonuclease subunit S n=1 Tax=Streptomyces sp. NBC_01257 TaxID=2903799 RepID=UPI002DD9F7CD|nr:restriction endonuclease subunit S [Streptomyces sp. NBC_01257]WRZ67355.1 restriction endonuclease subunit S [Streptomyces sp. NBC_01257]
MNHSYRLGDLCEITPSPSSDLFVDLAVEAEGVPVISPADIAEGRVVNQSLLRCLPQESADTMVRFKVLPDDLVVVRQGAVGKVALIEERSRGWIYHSSCIRLRPDVHAVHPAYLTAYLAHPPVVDQMLARTHVGTVATITAGVLAELPVALPPLQEQRLIAQALGEVDLQVDVQRRLLGRLEALRPALLSQMLGGEVPGDRTGKPVDTPVERRPGRVRRMNRMS